MNLSGGRCPMVDLLAPGTMLVSETGHLSLESSSQEQTDPKDTSRPGGRHPESSQSQPLTWEVGTARQGLSLTEVLRKP